MGSLPLNQRADVFGLPTPGEEFRQRALERLYERKALLDNLIETLEDYQSQSPNRPTYDYSDSTRAVALVKLCPIANLTSATKSRILSLRMRLAR